MTGKRQRVLVQGNWEEKTVVYSYDNEGRLTGASYPGAGPLTYTYDALGRLSGQREWIQWQSREVHWVRDVTYNAAGLPVSLVRLYQRGDTPGEDEYMTDGWSYNARLQMTGHWVRRSSGEYLLALGYYYPATTNNGRVSSIQDWVAGETVNFTYDALNRPTRAETAGPQWGQAYTYDGFGNMVAQTVTKGTAPGWTRAADGATNRLVGFSYDATGNVTWMPNATGYEYFEYDAENRLVRATYDDPEVYEQYRYGLDNRRLWRARQQGEGNRSEWAYFYGAYGELLGNRIYFGGRMIRRGGYVGEATLTDRLGSVGGRGKYYPYGQERQTTPQETAKFATYFRDSTGVDYAWNRYYTSTWGRFLQADPYVSPEALKNPQGWNRYAYVENDPVNFNDPRGLVRCGSSFSNIAAGVFAITVYDCVSSGDRTPPFVGGAGGDYGVLVPEMADADRLEAGGGLPQGPAGVLFDAFKAAMKALEDPDCAGLFNTDPNCPHTYGPGLVLQAMLLGVPLGGTWFGEVSVAPLPYDLAAWTKYSADWVHTGTGVRASSADIVLQGDPQSSVYYLKHSARDLALILLHELGHVFDMVTSLGGSAIKYDANPDGSPNRRVQAENAKLLEKCKRAIP